jgi:predicted permease
MWTAITRLAARFAATFRHRAEDSELDQEMDAHRSLLIDEYMRRGMSEDEARRAAHLTFGNATQLREAHREVRGAPILEELLRDVRYALRGFRRQPGFTAIAVLTFAVGIGANAAVFSIVDNVLMRPLPYEDPDRLMSLTRGGRQTPGQAPPQRWISLRRWEAMKDARTFEAGVYRLVYEDVILGGREPEVLRAGRFSANVLTILGVQPILGRTFRSDEDADGAAPVVLISERLWARRFGSESSVIGRTISIGSVPYTVVGILPHRFQFPARDIDAWFPQPANAPFIAKQFFACCSPLMGIARLRSGVRQAQADAELSVLNATYEPQGQRRVDAGAAVFAPLKNDIVGSVDSMLWMLLAAVGFVLLIACANVATLLMARATSRMREFALRTALGAGRARLVRQLVTESLLLSATGGALGLVIAWGGVRTVATMTLLELPRAHELSVNGTVLLWTTAIACVTGVLFGTFPSLQLLKPAVIDRLRQSGATERDGDRGGLVGVGGRSALVIVQVALSLVLLIGATLMAQTIARLMHVNLGFPSAGLLTMRVPLPVTTYDTDEKRTRFFDQLIARVNAIPGVRGATVARALPTTTGVLATNLQIESQRIPDPGHVGQMLHTVAPGFFEVLGLPLKQGRTFASRDNVRGAPPTTIVNEAFARKFWPAYPSGATPVGERLFIPILPKSSWSLEIVGVVADVRHGGPTREPDPQVYIPDSLYSPQVAYLALRADGEPRRIVDAVRAEIRAIDPNQSMTDVRMMDSILERATGQQHLAARVLGLFAATALLLAVIGLYGVMAYSVAHRTQEIGIRRALGAGHGEVLWMIVGQGLRVTLIGLVCGLVGAYASTRLLQSLLFEVSTTDGTTFVVVPAVFVVVAVLASLIPAARAARIDPVGALRV